MNIYTPNQHPSFFKDSPHTAISPTDNKPHTPYTYLIGWSRLDKWYYGVRYAKGCHPSELFIKYFTSSKYVSDFILKHGNPDIITIDRIFDSIVESQLYEIHYLTTYATDMIDKWLNKSVATGRMGVAGLTSAILVSTGERLGLVSVNDVRWDSGEIIHTLKNRIVSESHRENLSKSQRGKINSKESNIKNSESNKKVIHTDEWNKKVSISKTGKQRNPELMTPEWRYKLGNGSRNRRVTRVYDRKEMDIGNFTIWLNKVSL